MNEEFDKKFREIINAYKKSEAALIQAKAALESKPIDHRNMVQHVADVINDYELAWNVLSQIVPMNNHNAQQAVLFMRRVFSLMTHGIPECLTREGPEFVQFANEITWQMSVADQACNEINTMVSADAKELSKDVADTKERSADVDEYGLPKVDWEKWLKFLRMWGSK